MGKKEVKKVLESVCDDTEFKCADVNLESTIEDKSSKRHEAGIKGLFFGILDDLDRMVFTADDKMFLEKLLLFTGERIFDLNYDDITFHDVYNIVKYLPKEYLDQDGLFVVMKRTIDIVFKMEGLRSYIISWSMLHPDECFDIYGLSPDEYIELKLSLNSQVLKLRKNCLNSFAVTESGLKKQFRELKFLAEKGDRLEIAGVQVNHCGDYNAIKYGKHLLIDCWTEYKTYDNDVYKNALDVYNERLKEYKKDFEAYEKDFEGYKHDMENFMKFGMLGHRPQVPKEPKEPEEPKKTIDVYTGINDAGKAVLEWVKEMYPEWLE